MICRSDGCDLLENNYLCRINNNHNYYHLTISCVVICLKTTIFVVSTTTLSDKCLISASCDLLENNYLCRINNNPISINH